MERQEVEDRLLAVISDCVDGGIVIGFVVVAEYVGDDGDRRIMGATLSGQRAHTSLGLLAWADTIERTELARNHFDDDDDAEAS